MSTVYNTIPCSVALFLPVISVYTAEIKFIVSRTQQKTLDLKAIFIAQLFVSLFYGLLIIGTSLEGHVSEITCSNKWMSAITPWVYNKLINFAKYFPIIKLRNDLHLSHNVLKQKDLRAKRITANWYSIFTWKRVTPALITQLS